MEENKQLLELLEQIEKNSRRQVRLGRIQCLLSLAAAACCGAVLVLALRFLPQVLELLPQIDAVLTNLEATTHQLAGIDLAGMVTDVDTLVTTAQESLNQTMQKLDTIDFATLNKALQDLAAVTEPLSKLTKMFS